MQKGLSKTRTLVVTKRKNKKEFTKKTFNLRYHAIVNLVLKVCGNLTPLIHLL